MMIRNIIIFCILGIISGCVTKVEKNDKKIISVSILPQKYFVEAIAGDKFIVNVMIPPGSSPENYEPTAMQMQNLSESGIYLKIGFIPFEEILMKSLIDSNSGMKVYDLSEGINMIKEVSHHGENNAGVDPHIWSSVKNAKIITRNIFAALSKEDPANLSYYSENLLKFQAMADSMDKVFQAIFEPIDGASFLIFHPALAYLARDYSLTQVSLEFEGKTPPPGYMKDIIDISREKNIKAILVQKQFNSEPAETIAKEIPAKLIIIDPLDEKWKNQIEHITRAIIDAAGTGNN